MMIMSVSQGQVNKITQKKKHVTQRQRLKQLCGWNAMNREVIHMP